MIREFFAKILSVRNTHRGIIITILGEEFIPLISVEPLVDKLKILEAAMQKRIMTIKIMDDRLKKNKELIERMSNALESQNRQLHKQMDIINEQRKQLKHIDQIDWRMNKLKMEHKKLKKFASGNY